MVGARDYFKVQCATPKKTKLHIKWNSKKCSINSKVGRKGGAEAQETEGINRKQH